MAISNFEKRKNYILIMSALNELILRAWGMSRQAQLMTFIQLLAKYFVGKIQLLYYGLDVEIFLCCM